MTGKEIIAKVKVLKLPAQSFIVFGSCPLSVVGIREANDIDLLVSAEVFQSLESAGWQQVDKGPDDKPLVFEDFEAHPNWDFSTYNPTLPELLSRAMVVDGIPFASIEDVRQWKAASGRPKDIVDIERIDAYLAAQH